MKPRKPAVPRETEADFQQGIIDLARALGWNAYHTHDSRRSAAGFPDLVLVRNGRIIVAELKTDTGTVTPEQQMWLEAFEQSPAIEVFVWRPSNRETIVPLLARRAASPQPASDPRDQPTSCCGFTDSPQAREQWFAKDAT